MATLTDTHLVILSAASQRDDRGVELPANIKGEAARKVVAKLVRAGLLEEVRAAGLLPVWRRDDDSGAMALRITKHGLEAIDLEDEAAPAPEDRNARPACPQSRNTGTRSHCRPQAECRCSTEVRSQEASPGQGEDQSCLAAR